MTPIDGFRKRLFVSQGILLGGLLGATFLAFPLAIEGQGRGTVFLIFLLALGFGLAAARGMGRYITGSLDQIASSVNAMASGRNRFGQGRFRFRRSRRRTQRCRFGIPNDHLSRRLGWPDPIVKAVIY